LFEFSSEDFHRMFEAIERLRATPEGERLDLAKEIEAKFGDAAVELIMSALKVGSPFLHKIVLIHGIRDDGDWFNAVTEELPEGAVQASLGGYGYFHIFKFLTPRKRREAYDKVVATLRNAQGPMTVVSVVCHSFGTYCVTRAIFEHADIRLFRLVMCGGIVSREFSWDRVPARLQPGRVINECGNADNWPIIASRLSNDFGNTGRFGFSRTPVTDRFHDLDHGGFFTREFFRTFWAPFLAGGKIVSSGKRLKKPGALMSVVAGRF
jgi:hypothetical protein